MSLALLRAWVAVGMADQWGNLIAFPGCAVPSRSETDVPEADQVAAARLGQLAHFLQQLPPDPSRPRARWMIESTPFRMGLPGARRALASLAGRGRDGRSSARARDLRLTALETQDWLDDTDECLRALNRPDLPSVQLARRAKKYGDCRSELLPLLRRIGCPRPPGDLRTEPQSARRSAADLRRADARLKVAVDVLEERLGALDLAAPRQPGYHAEVEGEIFHAHEVLCAHAYAENGALRQDEDIGEAFAGQRGEFLSFYQRALRSLDLYREISAAYAALWPGDRTPLRPGGLAEMRQDLKVCLAERDECISTLRDFREKFSAMLAVLPPAG